MQDAMTDVMSGPFLLECRVGETQSGRPNWVQVAVVTSLQQALSVASKMSQAYSYRLYCGPSFGYYRLDWVDDPTDTESCVPVWKPL